jgi:hypothetical protein
MSSNRDYHVVGSFGKLNFQKDAEADMIRAILCMQLVGGSRWMVLGP